MWRLLIKNQKDKWEDLDINQEEILLCFEGLNSEKIEDRFASGTYSFDLPKTVNNNRLLQYIVCKQAYNINKTYIKCIFFNENGRPLGDECFLQILSQTNLYYKAVVLSSIKNIFNELEKIKFNDNNTKDIEYYNTLGYSYISYIDRGVKNDNKCVNYFIPYFDPQKRDNEYTQLIAYNEEKDFTAPDGQVFRLHTSRFPLITYDNIISESLSKFNVRYKNFNLSATAYLAPQYKKCHRQLLTYGNGDISSSHRNTTLHNGYLTNYESKSYINTNILSTNNVDSNGIKFDTGYLIYEFKSVVEDGKELPVFTTSSNTTDGLFVNDIDSFFQIGFTDTKYYNSTMWVTRRINGQKYTARYTWDIVKKMFEYIGNYDNWCTNSDGTHKIKFVLTLQGDLYVSSPNEYYDLILLYSDQRGYLLYMGADGTGPTPLKYLNTGDFYSLFNATRDGIFISSYIDHCITPDSVINGYYLQETDEKGSVKEGSLAGGIGEYTGNSYVNIQEIIGYSNMKELFLDYIKVLGCYYKINIEEGERVLQLYTSMEKSYINNNIEISEIIYDLDSKYNKNSFIGVETQNSFYADCNINDTIGLFQKYGMDNTEYSPELNMSIFNNPSFTDKSNIYDLKLIIPVKVKAYKDVTSTSSTRIFNGWDYVPSIPWTYNENKLSSDGLIIINRTDTAYNYTIYTEEKYDNFGYFTDLFTKIYSNYCKIKFNAIIDNPNNYLCSYFCSNGIKMFIIKIDKYTGNTIPCEVTALLLT